MSLPSWKFWLALGATAMTFIDAWIWHPAISYLVLVFLVFSDQMLTDFVAKRSFRPIWAGVILCVYTAVISIAHLFSKNEVLLGWLAATVFSAIVLIHFLSLLKNLGALHLMREELIQLLTIKLTRKYDETAPIPAALGPEPPPPTGVSDAGYGAAEPGAG